MDNALFHAVILRAPRANASQISVGSPNVYVLHDTRQASSNAWNDSNTSRTCAGLRVPPFAVRFIGEQVDRVVIECSLDHSRDPNQTQGRQR